MNAFDYTNRKNTYGELDYEYHYTDSHVKTEMSRPAVRSYPSTFNSYEEYMMYRRMYKGYINTRR